MSEYISWPAERFYWAVLEAPGVPVPIGKPRPPAAESLDLLLAPEVPVPIDELHAVYARLDANRVLACAAMRADLSEVGTAAVTLVPEAVPECIPGGADIDFSRFNLLVSDFEPGILKRPRRHAGYWVAATILLSASLLATGLLRRTHAMNEAAKIAQPENARLLAAALPEEPKDSPTFSLRLKAELDTLRRTRSSRGITSTPDAMNSLAVLLGGWPKATGAETDAVSATPSNLTMLVTFREGPQEFLYHLPDVHGWNRDEPRVSRTASGTQVMVQYRPDKPQ